ncbi:t22.10 [Tupaiid betaherpesvirus 1]|uniref:T22.10 n=1 Tax=Tupaiid herpesvirus 1 (strain 1) TaxID=10397 RepID=Q91TS9_TUHV1|nr:t22.10 [Tupaiid betaherpesvirus 1]AAK57058.1 t22.10 [Tupaiid betaherpesvirus 1]
MLKSLHRRRSTAWVESYTDINGLVTISPVSSHSLLAGGVHQGSRHIRSPRERKMALKDGKKEATICTRYVNLTFRQWIETLCNGHIHRRRCGTVSSDGRPELIRSSVADPFANESDRVLVPDGAHDLPGSLDQPMGKYRRAG